MIAFLPALTAVALVAGHARSRVLLLLRWAAGLFFWWACSRLPAHAQHVAPASHSARPSEGTCATYHCTSRPPSNSLEVWNPQSQQLSLARRLVPSVAALLLCAGPAKPRPDLSNSSLPSSCFPPVPARHYASPTLGIASAFATTSDNHLLLASRCVFPALQLLLPSAAALCALPPPSLTTRTQANPRQALFAAHPYPPRDHSPSFTIQRILNRFGLTMAATASASAALAQSAVDPGLEDSNVSSPLTEVDDKDDNDEEIDRMQIDGDDGDNSSLSGDDNPTHDDDRSDSASVLSDAGSDANSDGNDTEAETERLYDTPRHQRQKDVVVDEYNHGQVFEHTPSKLRRAAKPEDKDDDENETADRESVSGDEGSGASSAGGADDTPTKPVNKKKMLYDKAPSSDSLDRKRKRSPVADQSETEQPQKKRTGSVGAASIEDPLLNDDGTAAANVDSAIQSDAEDENRDTGTEGEAQERSCRSSRSSRKSLRNGLRGKDGVKEEDDDTGVDAATETAGEEATDNQEDEAEAEAEEEDEADIAAKNQEECKPSLTHATSNPQANWSTSGTKTSSVQGLVTYRRNVWHF